MSLIERIAQSIDDGRVTTVAQALGAYAGLSRKEGTKVRILQNPENPLQAALLTYAQGEETPVTTVAYMCLMHAAEREARRAMKIHEVSRAQVSFQSTCADGLVRERGPLARRLEKMGTTRFPLQELGFAKSNVAQRLPVRSYRLYLNVAQVCAEKNKT